MQAEWHKSPGHVDCVGATGGTSVGLLVPAGPRLDESSSKGEFLCLRSGPPQYPPILLGKPAI